MLPKGTDQKGTIGAIDTSMYRFCLRPTFDHGP